MRAEPKGQPVSRLTIRLVGCSGKTSSSPWTVTPSLVATSVRRVSLDQVELRVGDVRETLRSLDEPIDALLLDIWAPIAGDVAALVGPHLRVGGVIVADNTTARRELYGGLFDFLNDPTNGFTTQTLPFEGGLELAVKTAG